MKISLIRSLLLMMALCAGRQSYGQQPQVPTAKTYAVIIGIAQYDSADIPPLKYSNKDAKEFAVYLQSKAGGNVPLENIRLLIDKEATTASVYNALYWLVNICSENDLAYIYFAGHGDMENTTIYKLGFLLTSNTGPHNYINNSLRIEDLNNYANTISVTKKARIVIITDACHSGKLAEKHQQSGALIGHQLRTARNNEVRITACETNELSAEDEAWGGGRGVFSYYLLHGLHGLAETNQDGIITTGEIKQYLDVAFQQDKVLNENKLKQTPVISSGDKNFTLAAIDQASLVDLKKRILNDSLAATEWVIPEQPIDHFFQVLRFENLIDQIEFRSFLQSEPDNIPLELIHKVTSRKPGFMNPKKIEQLEASLPKNNALLKRFNTQLVEALHERGQQIINLYLKADEAEMERRKYYNANRNGYDIYPPMFELALRLTDKNNYLHRILEVNLHYFRGVVARLKLPTVEDPLPLLKEAMAEQKRAYELEENAAYIHNELGLLFKIDKEYIKAERHFLQASSIAPEWAVPWANLVSIYTSLEKFDKAEHAFGNAKELQPTLQGLYVNGGILQERKKNFLLAEEFQRKATQMNTRHYLPFERLGFVYLNTGNYALADSFFMEAAIRKLGYFFEKPQQLPDGIGDGLVDSPEFLCPFDTLLIKDNDLIGRFIWAYSEVLYGRQSNAERLYKKLIADKPTHFMAAHYLGVLLYRQGRWQESELAFKLAKRNFLEEKDFQLFCKENEPNLSITDVEKATCIIKAFKYKYYQRKEDYYFMGDLYALWKHFDESAEEYQWLIQHEPAFIGGYFFLWQLYEKFERYQDAEKTILAYCVQNKSEGRRELYAFYKRMAALQPGNGSLAYKAGTMLYQHFLDSRNSFHYDQLTLVPDTDGKLLEPTYVPSDPIVTTSITYNIPGTYQEIEIGPFIFQPKVEAVGWLLKADSLFLQEDDFRSDINDKLGNLYTWLHLPQKAHIHYRIASELQSNNAGTKMKLVDAYLRTWQNSGALQYLDSLYLSKQINLSHLLALAELNIHAGNFSASAKYVREAEAIDILPNRSITELTAKRYRMEGRYQEAIAHYKKLLQGNDKDPALLYTISRLYALSNNKALAFTYLTTAMENGFKYGYVLNYDPAWEPFQRVEAYKAFLKKLRLPY